MFHHTLIVIVINIFMLSNQQTRFPTGQTFLKPKHDFLKQIHVFTDVLSKLYNDQTGKVRTLRAGIQNSIALYIPFRSLFRIKFAQAYTYGGILRCHERQSLRGS